MPFSRGEYGKCGMFMISGEPNLGKTSLARTSLSLCSHPDFLYAFNSSKEFIQSLAQRTSGLIVVGKLAFADHLKGQDQE